MEAVLMKAAKINHYGDNVVEVVEINSNAAKPAVSQGKLLVKVHAAGINPIDWKICRGYMKEMMPLRFPATLGGDFSGVVEEAGEESGFRKGDHVFGQSGVLLGGSGSFADYTLAPAQNTAHKPESLSHIEAASLPLAGVSAYQALAEHIALEKGQKILIHGGSGGIGTFAVQIARHLGAHVIATARSDNIAYVKELGADEVIDYNSKKFEETINNADAVFDTVGGETYTRSFKALKKGGIIVSMLEQPNQDLMKKYGVRAVAQFTQVTSGRLAKLSELAEQGIIKALIGKTFSLDQAGEALGYLEKNHPRGKVVLKIR